MIARVRACAAALRDFARGFLGLAAPGLGVARGHGSDAARRAIVEHAERRPRCC